MSDIPTPGSRNTEAEGCSTIVKELLDLAYDTYRHILDFDRLCLALLDGTGTVLRVEWMRTDHPHPRIKKGFAFPLARTSLQGVIDDLEPRILDDTVAWSKEHPSSVTTDLLIQEGIASSVTVALSRDGVAIGVLFFSSDRLFAYSAPDIEPAQALADRVARALTVCDACALESAPVRREPDAESAPAGRPLVEVAAAVERAHREVRLISEIIEKINAGMLFHEVLDHVYDSFRHFLPVDRLGFARIDDDGERVRAVWGRNDTSEVHLPVGYNLPMSSSSLRRIMESGEPRILNDLEQYLEDHPESDSTRRIVAEGMRSSLTCPLVANGRPIGFLFFSSRRPEAYRNAHIDIFQRVAGHVAVTVEKGWIHKQLVEARDKSDELLHNTLPESIADRLREGGTIADYHPEVTVLFADLVGFSTLAARMSPREVVTMLNRIFSAFDDLTEAFGVEKIKTIGDAYLAVGGLPEPRSDHAEAALEVAFGMLETVGRVRGPFNEPIQVRIGMHTGPVVAGVIGKRKYGYDLWGDTVNLASRMQSHGMPGRIQVSARTRECLGDRYQLAPRGLVQVKGARSVETWFVEGRR